MPKHKWKLESKLNQAVIYNSNDSTEIRKESMCQKQIKL